MRAGAAITRLALLTAILLPMPALAQDKTAPRVTTAQGRVEGVLRDGVNRFLGLPFAAPPLGALRWQPPQPPRAWQGLRRAAHFAPICAQVTTLGPFAGPANSNEDCLYLNVFAPQDAAGLPVLVWIHGGGYVNGASNDYDAARLAARGRMVVVTINYRLNLMGFLAHPALGRTGNFGILDQQAALRWVRANIAAFGGDARNVTLGGQSAGAGAVTANLVSPAAKGLFHRAILQSGGYTPFTAQAVAHQRAETFAAGAGCNKKDSAAVARCLRALPAAKIMALAGTASSMGPSIAGPAVDGVVIPAAALELIERGAFHRMPVMIGTTRDEGNFSIGIAQYFRAGRTPATAADFAAYATRSYGGDAYPKGTAKAVMQRYRGPQAWNRAHSDMLACRGLRFARALDTHAPVHAYRFDDRSAPSYFPAMPGFVPGAYHTADLAYLFTGFHGGPSGVPVRLSGQQMRLSDRMIAAWSGFARNGNPNGTGNAPWPRHVTGNSSAAYFLQDDAWNRSLTNAQFAAQHQCGFWNGILLYR